MNIANNRQTYRLKTPTSKNKSRLVNKNSIKKSCQYIIFIVKDGQRAR